MAKKLMRVKRPLWLIFVELLAPWLVMGIVAVVSSSVGAPTLVVFVLALAAALATTWFVFAFERSRTRPRPQHRSPRK